MSLFVLFEVLLFLCVQSEYLLLDDYNSTNFEEMFDFVEGNDTKVSFTYFVDKNTAIQQKLFRITENNSIYIGVESTSKAQDEFGRYSLQLVSRKSYTHGLFILDLAHMPSNVCGTWPIFKLLSKDRIWPDVGETKVIENININRYNEMTLHCGEDCLIQNSTNDFTGYLDTANCYSLAKGQTLNYGCKINADKTDTYGSEFNKAGGGVYAILWTSEGYKIWHFKRSDIPEDIISKKPDPKSWTTALAQFYGYCDFDKEFSNQQMMFITYFSCGWSTQWYEDCKLLKASSCEEYVRDNPEAFKETYWLINSLKIYFDQQLEEITSTKTPTKGSNVKTRNLVGIYIGLPIALLAIVTIFFILFCWYRQRRQNIKICSFLNKIGNKRNVKKNEADPWKIERTNIVIDYKRKIGSGAFADVYEGQLFGTSLAQKFCNCKVAIKVLPVYASNTAKEDFQKEIEFMKSLQCHENLLCLIGHSADPTSLFLILEYCATGDLLKYLKENRSRFLQEAKQTLYIKELFSFAWQVANGLNYFTSLGFVHRDVAARNVLLDSNFVCKIGDFGLCRLPENEIYTSRGGQIPVKWSAIESLRVRQYSMKSDVWGYGVVLYEIFSFGLAPYPEIDNINLLTYLEDGNRMNKPDFCNNKIYDLMLKCWEKMPEDRPDFNDICQQLTVIIESDNTYYDNVNKLN